MNKSNKVLAYTALGTATFSMTFFVKPNGLLKNLLFIATGASIALALKAASQEDSEEIDTDEIGSSYLRDYLDVWARLPDDTRVKHDELSVPYFRSYRMNESDWREWNKIHSNIISEVERRRTNRKKIM